MENAFSLVQGVPGSEIISLDDPFAVALDWVDKGAKTLHLVDLDGAIEGQRKNAPIVERIVNACKGKRSKHPGWGRNSYL